MDRVALKHTLIWALTTAHTLREGPSGGKYDILKLITAIYNVLAAVSRSCHKHWFTLTSHPAKMEEEWMTITLYSTGKVTQTPKIHPWTLRFYLCLLKSNNNNLALSPLFLFHDLQVDLLSKYVTGNNWEECFRQLINWSPSLFLLEDGSKISSIAAGRDS